jgi:long-chain acyl-CoA synthetase
VAEQPTGSTLCASFQASAARVPDRVALRTPGDAEVLTWSGYAAAVERAAGSLAALGVGRGHRVAFLSRNRPELPVAEVAALHLGAAGVGLYTASPPATLEHVLRDSEPTVLLVESAMETRLAEFDHSVGQVFALDAGGSRPTLGSVPAPEGFDFQAAWRAVQPDDLAALIYTSGTTGPSKAVEWTHGAATGSLGSFDAALGEPDGIHDISFGPFPALAERYGGHWHALVRGSTRTLCADPTQLGPAVLEARPTRLGGSPQVWQSFRRALESTLDEQERNALDAAVERVRAGARREPASPSSEEQQAVLATLRARLGFDRLVCAGSTAAPCPLAVHEHYHALAVPFIEFFAMTEAGVMTAQSAGIADLGTLGRPVPGYELQIAEDGEVLARSPHAPCGYRNRPRETAETYRADGWIHTGDTGVLDGEGRLRLLGRKKEIIALENGYKVAPARVESALKDACPHIAHAYIFGETRPHLVALLVVDPPDSHNEPAIRATAATAIAEVNRGFDPRERIQAHAVVPGPWLPGAELTDTLKMRRPKIAERYASTIEQLYAR